MKKIIFASVFAALFFSAVPAQSSADYKKAEFFVGFSRDVVDGDSRRFFTTDNNSRDVGTLGFPGFEVSAVYNVSRYVVVKSSIDYKERQREKLRLN